VINLCQFLGGTGFKVDSRISKNQIALRTNALADTGANGQVFCDTKKAYEAIKYCNATTKRLREPIPVVDYAGRPGKEITHGISLDLELDGVIYPNTFMLITDCGKHDLLVGFQFLAQHGILLDPANKRLIQQVQEGPTSFGRTITVQPPTAEDQTVHQRDADRRDTLMNQQIHKVEIKILQQASPPPSPSPPRPWQRNPIHQTHDSNLWDSYNMMGKELERDGDDGEPKDPGPDEQSEPTRGRNW